MQKTNQSQTHTQTTHTRPRTRNADVSATHFHSSTTASQVDTAAAPLIHTFWQETASKGTQVTAPPMMPISRARSPNSPKNFGVWGTKTNGVSICFCVTQPRRGRRRKNRFRPRVPLEETTFHFTLQQYTSLVLKVSYTLLV